MTGIQRVLALFLAGAMAGTSLWAAGPTLVRIERKGASDREALIRAGVTLVHEFNGGFFALEDPGRGTAALEALGYRAERLERDTEGWRYTILGIREGWEAADALTCGDLVWAEENWVLVRSPSELGAACLGSEKWFVSPLTFEPLALPKPPPPEYAHLQEGPSPEAITPKPLVQQIVDAMTPAVVTSNWDGVINSATTRYSTSTGCQTAATYVYNKFSGLGLSPAYQNHTSGHAPNVIGTLTGKVNPLAQYIAIGHLDDLPSSGAAPGADDNASGSAMVTAAAELMAGYCFANTVKFLAVTGEEFGLYGSNYYANQAHTAGDDIQGVLNADMIGWAGDGSPNPENLDLNYNTSSQWLGQLFDECSTAYGTGCAVDDFLCSGLTASDHARFWYWGYSAVCGITDNEGYCSHGGNYPYYHTSNDTKANCGNQTFYNGAMKAYLATLAHLADPLCQAPFPNNPVSPGAAASGPNEILVTWSPSAGSGPVYEIYRAPGGCSGGFPYTKVGESAGSSYLDAAASGGIGYAYVVKSKKDRCVSAGTSCVQTSTTGPCSEAPSFAGVTGVTNPAQATCQLQVSWSPATEWCGGPVSYALYRSTSSTFTPGPSNLVASGVAGSPYTDGNGLVSGTTYYYVVRAVDLATGVEEANEARASGKPTGPLAEGTWTAGAEAGDPTLTMGTPWAASSTYKKSGGYSYSTNTGSSYPNNACAALTTPSLSLGTGSVLTYHTIWSIEAGWDGARVEISDNGGASWAALTPNPAYGSTLSYTGNACGWASGTAVYSGNSASYPTLWVQATVNLSAYANKSVLIRWRFSTDTSQAGSGSNPGIYVDDISITHVQVPGTCATLAAPGETGGAEGTRVKWTAGSKSALAWGANPDAAHYHLHRGVPDALPALLTSAADSCLRLDNLASPSATSLTEEPAGGSFFWYLVTGWNAAGEGPSGNGAQGPRALNSTGPCS